MTYDLDYFINKFSEIDDDKWTTGELQNDKGQCCAYGHCGSRVHPNETTEAASLGKICTYLMHINDGLGEYISLGSTPKQRVVNYLKSLKK